MLRLTKSRKQIFWLGILIEADIFIAQLSELAIFLHTHLYKRKQTLIETLERLHQANRICTISVCWCANYRDSNEFQFNGAAFTALDELTIFNIDTRKLFRAHFSLCIWSNQTHQVNFGYHIY